VFWSPYDGIWVPSGELFMADDVAVSTTEILLAATGIPW